MGYPQCLDAATRAADPMNMAMNSGPIHSLTNLSFLGSNSAVFKILCHSGQWGFPGDTTRIMRLPWSYSVVPHALPILDTLQKNKFFDG